MAGQIRMTPEQLKQRAKVYYNSGITIEDMMNKLNQVQTQIASEWEGRAFERYDEQFRQLAGEVEKFAQLMFEIDQQLQKTAEAMAQQDEALSQNFGLR